MFARRWFVRAAGFAVLAVALGCSRGGSGNLATVSGVVTQNGVPVNGAKVTFHSTVEEGGKGGHSYSAITDSNGKYLLASVGKDHGIPPGLYKVTITKLDLKAVNLPPDFDQGQMEASGMAPNVLSMDYENVRTTKLSVTLEPGKNENKDFDLKSGTASNKRIAGVP